MGFLDNSGDIILDAVLTEAGRRRMAQGSFRIVKFALGDDEIDYSLYNKNHPSGSAYYDLEILQTPIFEAFTQVNTGVGQIPAGSDSNRQSLLVSNGLIDNKLIISYDSRFISGIKGLDSQSSVANNATSNQINASLSLTDGTRTNINSGLENYNTINVVGIKNSIAQTTSPNTEADFSSISGPRGVMAAVAPVIKQG